MVLPLWDMEETMMDKLRTEADIEEMLIDILAECDNPVLRDVEITTFENIGFLTYDRGLVLFLEDGTEIRLTIHGYNADGVRME